MRGSWCPPLFFQSGARTVVALPRLLRPVAACLSLGIGLVEGLAPPKASVFA